MATATITINLSDGTRNLMASSDVLVSIRDQTGRTRYSGYVKGNRVVARELKVFNGIGDWCAVVASVKRCSDGGFFPVKLKANTESTLDLMLPPKKAAYDFQRAGWDDLKSQNEDLFRILSHPNPAEAGTQYETLRGEKDTHQSIACLLNITAAISCLPAKVDGGKSLLSLFQQIELTALSGDNRKDAKGLRPDRFYAWVDDQIKQVLEDHSKDNTQGNHSIFEKATIASSDHPGATVSYKETRFGEGNLQFSFHEKEEPPDSHWIKVEMDMDYFKDDAAHFVLEWIPNTLLTKLGKLRLTDPAKIYALRWMAGKQLPKEPEFDPLYTLKAAP